MSPRRRERKCHIKSRRSAAQLFMRAVENMRQSIEHGQLSERNNALLATVCWLCIFEVRRPFLGQLR